MRRRGASLPVFGLLLLLVAAGCRTPPSVEPGLRIEGTRLAIDDARAERVLRAYLERAEARSALRGSARVVLEGPDFKLNRPQRILVERPARLRFEVLGLFDQLAALLATDGRAFGFYDASEGRVSRGIVTPSLLWDLAKIDLDIDEVVGLLLAAPLPTPGIARAAVWLEPDGRIALAFAWPNESTDADCLGEPQDALFAARCFVSFDALGEGGEVFFFDSADRLAEVRDIEPGGIVRYRASFEDYRPLGRPPASSAAGHESVESARPDGSETAPEIEFPNRLTVRSPEASSTARFTWKRVMLADALSDRFFTLPVRDGAAGGG